MYGRVHGPLIVLDGPSQAQLTQQELIRACIKRNRKAQYVFYKTYFQPLYAICFRYMRDDTGAMEMLNLGFAKVMLGLKKYDQKQSLDKWMKTIVINTIIDEFRKTRNYREKMTVADEHTMTYLGHTTDGSWFDGEAKEAIEQKLLELPELTAQVFNLYAVDGYKHKEIATMLDIPEGTIHWHYSSAKNALRAHLKQTLNYKAS